MNYSQEAMEVNYNKKCKRSKQEQKEEMLNQQLDHRLIFNKGFMLNLFPLANCRNH